MSERTDKLKENLKIVADADAAERQKKGMADIPVGTPENPSTQILTPANIITFCRLALTIAFLVLFTNNHERLGALICYSVAAVTDFLDGQVARRTQTVSWLGKMMDPVMDRVLLFTGVLGLLIVGDLPLWVPVFVIGRDVILAIGGMFLQKYRKRPIDVVFIGKVATALLMIGFCDLLCGWPMVDGLGVVAESWLPGLNSEPAAIGIYFVYAGCICSFITAVVYFWEGICIRKEVLSEREEEAKAR